MNLAFIVPARYQSNCVPQPLKVNSPIESDHWRGISAHFAPDSISTNGTITSPIDAPPWHTTRSPDLTKAFRLPARSGK